MMHRLDAIGDRELRKILLFARAQPLPVTADEVAAAGQAVFGRVLEQA